MNTLQRLGLAAGWFWMGHCLLASAGDTSRHWHSGPRLVPLLELYTSEGCSSCPPADAWLHQQAAQPGLWRDFVPVAFHVDYWDHLGWPDRFASRANTERQSRYAALWRASSIYTPGFVRNGQEWRDWQGTPTWPESGSLDAGQLDLVSLGTNRFALTYVPGRAAPRQLEGHLVWLGSGLKSDVTRGENAGRSLLHDFVVLKHVTSTLLLSGDRWQATVVLPPPTAEGSGKRGIAAWVSPRGVPTPLQAVGGWWMEPGAKENP